MTRGQRLAGEEPSPAGLFYEGDPSVEFMKFALDFIVVNW